ncbi:mandelate racemase/muconate lactonizing enzyme family protein [Azohydromonas sediminis]|uniref:mandelate racemase/muconate lactonizing enzyme family protein n=1 Tax=Azohydromonas sediminis TaxID=2259674 RepID=UPI000E656F04|nr:mandelate racemase/muconate lactonizing enzyme family protein [Azohydromonas sediminis]
MPPVAPFPDEGRHGTVSAVRTRVVVRRSERPAWNPRTLWNEKRVVLVELLLDSGLRGIGEAYCDGGTTDAVVAIIERDLAPRVIGRCPLSIRQLWHEWVEGTVVACRGGTAFAAISALDTALWDLAGRVLNLPVYRLLGGARHRVPVYASGGLYGPDKSPDDLAAEMLGYVRQGFTAVKMKIGGLPIAQDVDRVRAVREAIGPGVRLMVDALYTYTAHEALRMSRQLERFDIHFLEAPVLPGDLEGLRQLCARGAVPIAGNEFAYGMDQFRELVLAGVHVVHADVILCGGISAALRVADLADAFHRSVSFHAASSLVCLVANAHVAAATANAESVEYHMVHQLLFDEVAALPFERVGGELVLADRPGLGVDLDFDATPAAG